MAGLNKLIFEEPFSSSSFITVTHNTANEFVNVKVVIAGQYRTDLVSAIDFVSENELTVTLISAQTGYVQVFEPDLVLIDPRSRAHAFGGVEHTADTKANVDSKISDANLFSTLPNEINAETAKTAALDLDVLLIEDSAASFAKKKATVTDIIFGDGASTRNQIVSAVNGPILDLLANGAYALVQNMTITPPAGTYVVYGCVNCIFLKNTGFTIAIYAGGTIYAPSQMKTNRGASNNDTDKTCSTQGEVTVDGNQAIELQAFYLGTNTVSYTERSMIIMRTQ